MSAIVFETTPNPDALRIVSDRPLPSGPPRQFVPGEPASDPLAAALLAIDGIVRVMIGPDFVTVVRDDPARDWDALRPQIAFALLDTPEIEREPSVGAIAAVRPERSEVEQQIEDVLDRWVRPGLGADGGNATLTRFDAESGTAWIRMTGACGGCPSGPITLKRGIEQTVRRWVPEVVRVAAAEDPSTTPYDPRARFRDWVARKWGAPSE
jgi:Fe-S cluster biogenesis protein NfuA